MEPTTAQLRAQINALRDELQHARQDCDATEHDLAVIMQIVERWNNGDINGVHGMFLVSQAISAYEGADNEMIEFD